MSHYVIGDIHGCYDDLMKMIKKIHLKDSDELYLVGDYIDRGDQNVRIMEWLEDRPANVFPVRGNHDANYAYYIDLMNRVEEILGEPTDPESNKEACLLYAQTLDILQRKEPVAARYFDMYGTIRRILLEDGVCMEELRRWAAMFRSFPLFYRLEGVARMDAEEGRHHHGKASEGEHRPCVIVHAGYNGDLDENDREEFFLEARKPAYTEGGLWNGMVIAGHTPTFIEEEFTYSGGGVFRYVDRLKNCVFYDIDCGCVFRGRHPDAKLACLRIEDEKVYYI